MEQNRHIEITLRLWARNDPDALGEYVNALLKLLPRSKGQLERRFSNVDPESSAADAVLVLSFPDAASLDSWLRDPLRADIEELAQRALAHSLITNSQHRVLPDKAKLTEVIDFFAEATGEANMIELRQSDVHGTGVFARLKLTQGTHIGKYFGTPTKVDGKHVLWVELNDGTWQGINGSGNLRFLNHSQSPNVEFDGVELYALRDIEAGEELLFDYGEDWADTP